MDKFQKKKRRWLKVIGIFLLVILIGTGCFAYSVFHNVTKSIDDMHTPMQRESTKRTENINLTKTNPFSVLVLGVDERENDRGRSDTMIVLTVNNTKQSIKMVSIPRDSYTEMIGRNTMDKINHAYAFGGITMAMDTVENFLDIPIDYYVKVNMKGFQDIVDALGGVTVENELDFTYGGEHFEKGTLTLTGEEALKYSRMRYEDPNGDFGRQNRQRQIIQAIIEKGVSLSSLVKYNRILDALSNNIQTNLTFDELNDIQKNYRKATKTFDQITIEGSDKKIDGIYYYIVPKEGKTRLQNNLKEHLEL